MIFVKECVGFGACHAQGFLLAPRQFHSPHALAHHFERVAAEGPPWWPEYMYPIVGGGAPEKISCMLVDNSKIIVHIAE